MTLHSQNSSTQLQWKPPYYTLNQESDVIQVDPNITHYTVYTTNVQHTRRMIGWVEKTETSFTLSNIHNEDPCPMYQVSAWNTGGEGELSEPVQDSTTQGKQGLFELIWACLQVFQKALTVLLLSFLPFITVPHSIAVENVTLTLETDLVHIYVEVSLHPFIL